MSKELARFPEVLHQILDDAKVNGDEHIISWLPCGRGFKVHNTKRFAEELMPTYFSNNKYKSFLRQLSLYEFKRASSGKDTPGPRGSYEHPYFRRDRHDLLEGVIRVKDRKAKRSAWASFTKQDDDDVTSRMTSSSSSISTEKYLDPSAIVRARIFSWDILEEIVQTFVANDDDLSKLSFPKSREDQLASPIQFRPISWSLESSLFSAEDQGLLQRSSLVSPFYGDDDMSSFS